MHKLNMLMKSLLMLAVMAGICVGFVPDAQADQAPVVLPDAPAAATPYRLADIVAQRDFTQTAYNTVGQSRGMHLGGVHVHTYPSGARAMYITDSGNNRILAFFNPDWRTPGDLPDRVFGQSDGYETSACNGDNTDNTIAPTARTLCLNRGEYAISQEEEPRFSAMDTDPHGNLFMIDQYNNRVLMFLDPFGVDAGEGDTTADRVWGQADFSAKICNRGKGIPTFPRYDLTADSLCTTDNRPASIDPMFATGLDIDTWGNLWVTDLINNRVLRFPYEAASGFPRYTADIVVGQPNMTSLTNDQGACSWQPAGQAFCQLFYLQVHPVTGELFVIHNQYTPRITVYAPNTTEQNPTSYRYVRQFGLGELHFPGFFHFLGSDRIIVDDLIGYFRHGLHIYTTSGTFLRTLTTSNVVGTTADGPVEWAEIKGKFVIVDNLLFLTEQVYHNSVMVFDISQLDSQNRLNYLGELLAGPNNVWNRTTGLGIRSPYGMAISEQHDQLFVADRYRVLVWDTRTPFKGRAADFVIGQPNFVSNAPTSSGPFVFRAQPKGMAIDTVNNRLWVARGQEIYAFNLPITGNSPLPSLNFSARIPNSIYTGNLPVRDQAQNFVFEANSVAFNPFDMTLWIVDARNSRVARVSNPYSTPQVDFIIGQAQIDGTGCNRGVYSQPTSRTLCYPGIAAFDNFGNLYIAEGVYEGRDDTPGNKRIVQYDKATLDAAIAAGLLSEPAANRVYSVNNFNRNPLHPFYCLDNTPCNPIAIAFDAENRMAVLSDAYFNTQGKRIYLYTDPLKTTGYVAFNPAEDTLLTYHMGQGGIPAFADGYRGFYQDHTWNRVLVVHANRPPNAPQIVAPGDDLADLRVNTTLQWTASDPDSDALTYTVLLGTHAEQLEPVATHLAEVTLAVRLAKGTQYFWQIVASDGLAETRSSIWTFSTSPGPQTVTYLAPQDQAVNQPLDVTLEWAASSDPSGAPVTYDVLVGTAVNDLQIVAEGQSAMTFTLPRLAPLQTYYWKINALSEAGANTESAVWGFTTYNQPGLVLSHDTLTLSEAGESGMYTIALTVPPTADVQIGLVISPEGHLTSAPSSVIFTPDNWDSAQPITLTTVDNVLRDGLRTVDVVHSSLSDDPRYNAIALPTIRVTIIDDDFTVLNPELLLNGSFETNDDALPSQPDHWVSKHSTKDGLRCQPGTAAYDGNCVYVFRGGQGEKSVLMQAVSDVEAVNLNRKVRLQLYYRTNTVQPRLRARLIVEFADGRTQQRAFEITQTATQFRRVRLKPITIPDGKTVTQVRIALQNKATRGVIFVDAVSATTVLTPPPDRPTQVRDGLRH